MSDKKEHTIPEVLAEISSTIKKSIDKFSGELAELQKIEKEKNDQLAKKSPPGFSEEAMHKLKDKYGTESAFKIAWSAHNKNKGKKTEKNTALDSGNLLGSLPMGNSSSNMDRTLTMSEEGMIKKPKKPKMSGTSISTTSMGTSLLPTANASNTSGVESSASIGGSGGAIARSEDTTNKKSTKKNATMGYGAGSGSVGTSVAPVMRSEDMIDRKNSNKPSKDELEGSQPRFKNIGAEGKLPGDSKEKKVDAPGSGGTKKAEQMGAKPPTKSSETAAPVAKPSTIKVGAGMAKKDKPSLPMRKKY